MEIIFCNDGAGSGRQVLTLDGPLQITRNNSGDLVAKRMMKKQERPNEVPLKSHPAPNRSDLSHSGMKASSDLGTASRDSAAKDIFQNQASSNTVGEDKLAHRPVSPQRSLRTIIDLDAPDSDQESDVSPISDERPLATFYPELQGYFAAIPRDGAESKLNDSKTRPGKRMLHIEREARPRAARSRIENNVEERVKRLYHKSTRNQSDVHLNMGSGEARARDIPFPTGRSKALLHRRAAHDYKQSTKRSLQLP